MKAVILAGGKGKRLKPLTDELPKPLIPILGRPIITWQIEWLKRYGIKDFVISIGHLKERFLESIGNGEKSGIKISYAMEDEPLGTGGCLKNAMPLLFKEEFFYVLNGDIITDMNPLRLLQEIKGAIGAIALVPLHSPYGIVKHGEDGVIISFEEKPLIKDYWINAGIYLFKHDIFDYLPDVGDLERMVFPELARLKKLKAVRYYDVLWRPIDTYKDLEEAERVLRTLA